MTESEWLACLEPAQMLHHLGESDKRKLRLFAVACCRRVLRQMANQRCREAVEVAERYADGQASRQELHASYTATLHNKIGQWPPKGTRAAAHAVTYAQAGEAARGVVMAMIDGFGDVVAASASLCDLLREIFGPGPFRPVAAHPDWFAWQGGVVRQMAQAIYDEGHFENLPVLADALEEAGCTDGEILWHCRSDGEHVRGCWVLDLLLGKG